MLDRVDVTKVVSRGQRAVEHIAKSDKKDADEVKKIVVKIVSAVSVEVKGPVGHRRQKMD